MRTSSSINHPPTQISRNCDKHTGKSIGISDMVCNPSFDKKKVTLFKGIDQDVSL
jgi:hypothetical protein